MSWNFSGILFSFEFSWKRRDMALVAQGLIPCPINVRNSLTVLNDTIHVSRCVFIPQIFVFFIHLDVWVALRTLTPVYFKSIDLLNQVCKFLMTF